MLVIPPFNDSGFLPPYTGENSTIRTLVSPYKATMLEFATQFATSPERRAILRGLLRYRAVLRSLGIWNGYQWLDGSFCSDIERLEMRPPGDIDAVTYAYRPTHAVDDATFIPFFMSNLNVFDPEQAKAIFNVDAYFIDLNMKPHVLVERTSYWHGVFGHQRVTSLWKGMVRVELACDDAAASRHLDDLDAAPQNVRPENSGSTIESTEALTAEGATNA